MTYQLGKKMLYKFDIGSSMKGKSVLMLLFALLLLCFSCVKEIHKPIVTLHVNLENRLEEIEWMEVQGSRSARDGVVFIEATGFNAEHFYLNLQNIADTGLVTGITINNVFFSDAHGFNSKTIKQGFLRISQRNAHTLTGVFEFYFQDDRINNTVKVEGSFRVDGSE
ncbi:MAG TPA: hypothetical protein VEY32_12005 [Flavisolibacter sp.]|nr:hypothetical protein [Flavisolibacter sp.]